MSGVIQLDDGVQFGDGTQIIGAGTQLTASSMLAMQGVSSIGKANNGPIGGYKVGATGAVGSIYQGFTLSWGDDFNALDLVGPTRPTGKYFPTKNYGSGIRGNQTSSGTAQETDPLWTGYNDINRGTALGFSKMYCSASVLALGARKAS